METTKEMAVKAYFREFRRRRQGNRNSLLDAGFTLLQAAILRAKAQTEWYDAREESMLERGVQ